MTGQAMFQPYLLTFDRCNAPNFLSIAVNLAARFSGGPSPPCGIKTKPANLDHPR